jgi:hypothetical protein
VRRFISVHLIIKYCLHICVDVGKTEEKVALGLIGTTHTWTFLRSGPSFLVLVQSPHH